MIHAVTARNRTHAILKRLPMVAAIGLLTTATPPPAGTRGMADRTSIERAVVPVSRTVPSGKLPPLESHRIPLPLQHLRPAVQTWTGRDVLDVRWAQRPAFTLPRSPYGDATWNAITDDIHYDPFPSPSPAYFYGAVHAVTGGTGTAFTAACAAASDNEIVEIQTGQSASTITSHRLTARGTAGYVWVRDQDTYAGLPEWHTNDRENAVRVNPFTHLANANVWTGTTAHQGAYLSCDDSAAGYVISGIYWKNGRIGVPDQAGFVVTAPLSTPANETSRIVFQHCATDGKWTFNTATRQFGRRGISPTTTGCKIFDCDMRGHVSSSTDANCINTSSAIGQIVVDNCSLESGAETLMWGGTLSNRGLTTEVMGDLRVTRCWAWRRDAWMAQDPSYNLEWKGQKNFWECKNASRWLLDRNAARNYTAQGQQYMMIFKSVSQSYAGEPLVVKCEDITVRYCDFDNYHGGPFQFAHNYTAPQKPATGAGKGPAKQCMREQIYGCRFRNSLDTIAAGASYWLMTPGDAQSGFGALCIPDVRVERNTFDVHTTALNFGSGFANSLPGLVITDNAWVNHTHYFISASQAGTTDPIGVVSGGTHILERNLVQAGQYYSAWKTIYAAANFMAPAASPIQFDSEFIVTDPRYVDKAVDNGPLGVPGAHFLAQIAGLPGSTAYST